MKLVRSSTLEFEYLSNIFEFGYSSDEIEKSKFLNKGYKLLNIQIPITFYLQRPPTNYLVTRSPINSCVLNKFSNSYSSETKQRMRKFFFFFT